MKREQECIFWAATRAAEQGFFPAQGAPVTDWARVLDWADRAQMPGFVWEKCDGRDHGAILVGPGPDGTVAIYAGQCRLLGGLLAGKPVPESELTWLTVKDPTRPWGEPPQAAPLEDLVPTVEVERAWPGAAPLHLRPVAGRGILSAEPWTESPSRRWAM